MTEPEFISCAGFDENVVLAVKNCFYDDEMRCILMKKTDDKIKYHDRRCLDFITYLGPNCPSVSTVCKTWFNSLSCDVTRYDLGPPSVKYENNANVSNINNINVPLDNIDSDNGNDLLGSTSDSPTPLDQLLEPEVKVGVEEPVKVEAEEERKSSAADWQESEKDQTWTLKGNNKFSCDLCEVSFKLRGSLNKHKARMHKPVQCSSGKFPCEKCGRRFKKLSSLRKHSTRKHYRGLANEISEEIDEEEVDQKSKIFTCDCEGCDAIIFYKKSEYKNHMKTVHNVPRKGRKPKDPMDEVLMAKLGLDLNKKENECPQSCEYCGKIYETKIKLYWHHKRVHQMKHRPCHLCGLMVKKLSDHIKRQHTEKDVKKFVCEFCGDRFKGQSGYQFHIAGHTGEKKYICRSCGKNFRTSSEAYNCERGHQGIFKWNCSLCTFKSHQRNKYVRHLRTHTKSQPFVCPVCDHRAARKDYMQKHIIKAHGSNGLTLEQIEALHPTMYNIDEKLDLPTPLSYEKLNLPGKSVIETRTVSSDIQAEDILRNSLVDTAEAIRNDTEMILQRQAAQRELLLHREVIQREALLKKENESNDHQEAIQRISTTFLERDIEIKRIDDEVHKEVLKRAEQEQVLLQDHLEPLVTHSFLQRGEVMANSLQREVMANSFLQRQAESNVANSLLHPMGITRQQM